MSDKPVYQHFLEVLDISTLKALEETPEHELVSILNDAADAVDVTNTDDDETGNFCAFRLREAADFVEMNELHKALKVLKGIEFAFDTYTSYTTFYEG